MENLKDSATNDRPSVPGHVIAKVYSEDDAGPQSAWVVWTGVRCSIRGPRVVRRHDLFAKIGILRTIGEDEALIGSGFRAFRQNVAQ